MSIKRLTVRQQVALAVGATRFMRFAGAAKEAPGKWKWLFVNGLESKGLISAATKFLNSGRDETNPSTCSGISYRNNYSWEEQLRCEYCCNDFSSGKSFAVPSAQLNCTDGTTVSTHTLSSVAARNMQV